MNKKIVLYLLYLLVIPLLYILSRYNFLLFHSIIEFSTIIIGVVIFLVSLITAKVSPDSFIDKLSPGLAAYSVIIFFHTLSYKGMGILTFSGSNFATSTWIAGNYVLSISILLAIILINKKYNSFIVYPIYFLVVSFLLVMIRLNLFPVSYIEGVGLTNFKIISEYVIILILLVSIFVIYKKRKVFSKKIYLTIMISLVLIAISEYSFTLYISVYGIPNVIGHIFKFFGFSFLFYGIVITNLLNPYSNLFDEIVKEKDHEKQLRKSLNVNNIRLLQSQQLANLGSWTLDFESSTIWASDQAFSIYGLEITKDNTLTLEKVQEFVLKENRERLDNALKNLINKGIPYDEEFIIIDGKGNKKDIHSTAVLSKSSSDGAIEVIGSIQDISDIKRNEKRLEFLSYHDSLTNLYNRRFFEEELTRLDTPRNYPLAVVLGDVNGLKIINDSFGHNQGDALLKVVANTIKNSCRSDDIIARWGGDEFTIILTNATKNSVETFINRIHDALSNESINKIPISISLGYALKDDEKLTKTDFLKKAEDRMYQSKLFEGKGIRGQSIEAFMATLYEKDLDSEQHSSRVSKLSYSLSKSLGLSESKTSEIKTAALLHDIGKITISNYILNKPGRLTSDEYDIIKEHPESGYRILNSLGNMGTIATYVLYHHERIDGKGYPKEISDSEIPLESKIISIADAYDAMTSPRSYKKKLSKQQAISELKKCSGTQFDKTIVEVFINKVLINE